MNQPQWELIYREGPLSKLFENLFAFYSLFLYLTLGSILSVGGVWFLIPSTFSWKSWASDFLKVESLLPLCMFAAGVFLLCRFSMKITFLFRWILEGCKWGCIHEGNVAKLTEEIRDTLSDAAIWEKIVYSGGQRWVVPAKAWRVLAVGDKIRVTQSPFRRMTVRVERAINKT